MSGILLAWELGGGLGHLGRLLALARELAALGRAPILACPASTLATVARIAPGLPVLAAPDQERRHAFAEPASFAEVLVQFGFDDVDLLASRARAWRTLFERVGAEVVVFDYAPVALLAAQGLPAARVLFGTGFACPPDRAPPVSLRPWQDHYPDRLAFNEARMLDSFNAVLAGFGQTPLARVAELFTRVERNALATLPELDHYPDREGGDYRGNWTLPGGVAPDWPTGAGPRVFVYLQAWPGLPTLARALAMRGARALLHVPDLDAATRARLEALGARCAPAPVDIGLAARDADLAILHGGHNATAAMLLAGRPVLALPRYAEQALTARALIRLGAGREAALDDDDAIAGALAVLLDDPEPARAAMAFGARHAALQAPAARRRLAGEIAALAGSVADSDSGSDFGIFTG